jgi:hypothetical protein
MRKYSVESIQRTFLGEFDSRGVVCGLLSQYDDVVVGL